VAETARRSLTAANGASVDETMIDGSHRRALRSDAILIESAEL
jgi:hypothetical protein